MSELNKEANRPVVGCETSIFGEMQVSRLGKSGKVKERWPKLWTESSLLAEKNSLFQLATTIM